MKYLFSFLAVCMCAIGSYAKVIEVCNNCASKTINEAVKTAARHDTIQVSGGVYYEQAIIIDKPITLIGIDRPIIDGEFKATVFEFKADSITLSGFLIRNIGVSYTKDFAAIHLFKSNNYRIENNVLENAFFGILVEKSHYGIIENNMISSEGTEEHNSGNGIHLWHCSHSSITNNQVTGMRDGIYLEFVSESDISNNTSFGNIRYGLHFMFSNNDDYYDNDFYNNGGRCSRNVL